MTNDTTASTTDRPHVLVSVLGTSPQVVTEALWHYWRGGRSSERAPISEVFLVSTVAGIKKAEESLLGPDGAWAELERICERKAGIEWIPLRDTAGRKLEDVRNLSDVDQCLQQIYELVLDLKQRQDRPIVHASIAGGRKTLGVSLALALQLCADSQDELIHVLVEPEVFERARDFFFPDQQANALVDVAGRGKEEDRRPAADARIDVARIPFPRLGGMVEKKVGRKVVRYHDVVEMLQGNINSLFEEVLVIDVAAGCLRLGRFEVALTPQEVAVYAFYADRFQRIGQDQPGTETSWYIRDHEKDNEWPEDVVACLKEFYPDSETMWRERPRMSTTRSRIKSKIKKSISAEVAERLQVKSEKRPDPEYGELSVYGVDLRDYRFEIRRGEKKAR